MHTSAARERSTYRRRPDERRGRTRRNIAATRALPRAMRSGIIRYEQTDRAAHRRLRAVLHRAAPVETRRPSLSPWRRSGCSRWRRSKPCTASCVSPARPRVRCTIPLRSIAASPRRCAGSTATSRPAIPFGTSAQILALYAALKPRVRASEPSAASYAALVRKIEMNGLGDRVSALCLALAERNGVDYLQMAHTGAGHSMHAFAQLETIKGRIRPVF